MTGIHDSVLTALLAEGRRQLGNTAPWDGGIHAGAGREAPERAGEALDGGRAGEGAPRLGLAVDSCAWGGNV